MSPSPNSPHSPVESHAEALEAHLSNLQTRLAATLDALDELTRNHELELEELHDRAHTLRARCQVFKARAKDAEAERDELREGVNKLVEKVEIANDHRVLPYSRIHLPDPLEPASFQSSIRLEDDVHRDAYLSAILSSLRAELVAEKYAFSELNRISEATIATLKAQVARRDAELQAYKPCSCYSSAALDPVSHITHKRDSRLAGPRLPNDQALKALEEAAVRQRTLEVEVEGLRRKLQSAQSTVSHRKWERSAPRALEDTSSKHREPSSTRPNATHAHAHPDLPIHPVISDIDRQLVHISRQVDSLQAERDNVTIEVHANRENDGEQADDREGERFRGVLLIEEECIRLRQSERSLRQQLLVEQAASSTTKQSLKSLINRLQQQLYILRNPDTSDDYTREERQTEGDMDPPEEVMNDVVSEYTITTHVDAPLLTPPFRCSTPLPPPSASLPPSWIAIDDPDTDAQLLYSRPPSAPPSLPQNPSPVQRRSAARLARIESELHQARNDVKEKDRAIDYLRNQVAALQAAVQARTRHEKE